MYLDFISDIAKKGDTIRITCKSEAFEGIIVKISSSMLAIKLSNGALVIKKDEEIDDLSLMQQSSDSGEVSSDDKSQPIETQLEIDNDSALVNNSRESLENHNIEETNTESTIDANKVDNNRVAAQKQHPSLEQSVIDEEENLEVTIGEYNNAWDNISKPQLLKIAQEITNSLDLQIKNTIVSGNANVREVLKRSFRVSTEERPTLSVRTATIIEKGLMSDLIHFNIGDTLPVVIYYHDLFDTKTVFLTLTPNTIGGYIEILKNAIKEGHYKEAKSLCYFLLSQIKKGNARSKLFEILTILKPINAWMKDKQDSLKSSSKIPKDYKQLEKRLNELVNKGMQLDAIELINKALEESDIDLKYKSSLLLRKAQAYSALTDYSNAKLAYIELIHFKESTDGDPKNLSHLYTELARLRAMDKSEIQDAQKAVEKALSYNPSNKYASTLLEQIKSGAFLTISVSSSPNSTIEDSDEEKELILDSDDSSLSISKMIDLDIKEHRYSNDLIIANGGVSSPSIADAIYQEAKHYKGVDLGERYPIYLEAAKAYSELPVGSYDYSNYMESVAFYAVYKGNFLFTKFNNDIQSGKKSDLNYLRRLRDSACSYYIESLNLLSNTKSEILNLILCNYLKLNVAIINLEKNNEVDLTGNFNKVFSFCINSQDHQINEIAWHTIIIIGSTSSNAWNQLWTRKYAQWRIEFYKALKDDKKRPEIYKIINKQNRSNIDEQLSPGSFLKKSLAFRQERNIKFSEVLSSIAKEDFNIHLLTPLYEKWNNISEYSDLLNETEFETKSVVDNILVILKPYPNRSQVERTNILIQVQRKIDEQIIYINENTTFYGRTFFYPLLSKWKKTVVNLLEQKIADTLPQLIVVADPPYIVSNESVVLVNLIIKNQGESTAEGCVISPVVTNLHNGNAYNGSNRYDIEIPAGNNLEVPMRLPPEMSSATSIKLSMSVSAIYQGKEMQPQVFEFTLEKEPESSLSYEDIPWKDGPIPAEQMFKGRQTILNRLKKHYTSIERDKPYILYGLTRTGKSSILKYLRESLDRERIIIRGVHFTIATFEWDLSQASNFGNAQDMWEYLLYDQFNEYLEEYIGHDGYMELGMSQKPRAKDLNNALQFLHKKKIYPMFLVDEFSYIKVMMDNNVVNPAFLHTLRQLSLQGLASFIYAGTYDIKALLKDSKYGITGQLVNAVEEQISEIDKQSAEELIGVLGDKLKFTPDAIEHIHKLSGDVPYFVQMICKYCGLYAVEKKRSIIGYPELEYIIKILTGESEMNPNSMVKTLPENVFQNNMFSPADPIEVHVLISSIAYYNRDNKENPRGVGIVELQELWAKKDIAAFRPKLAESIELLCQKKVLIQKEDEGLPVYIISVDLFRRWWAVHYPDINLQLDKILS